MNANSEALAVADLMGESASEAPPSAKARISLDVNVTNRIQDVEGVWRSLTSGPIESPGQSYDFIRLWVEDRRIPADAQRYVVGSVDGQPIALLPLHRKRVHGVRVFTWFPGPHAGCYTPVVDANRLAALTAEQRRDLWSAMANRLTGADLLYLRAIPTESLGHNGLFDELGSSLQSETLYRAEFQSWEECDGVQRSRSRRKHDRQQGDRLAALGEVGFEEIADAEEARLAIDIMFQQRSARFRAQGIEDCFVADNLVGFFQSAARKGSGIDVRLHALRLDGAIVAMRYSVAYGDRLFCLISSMSDCDQIQGGSPGKQCLLRVMQGIFLQGFRVFDMGAGFTDEKRHWCNVQVQLRHHYVPLSPAGLFVVAGHRMFQRGRLFAKNNPTIKTWMRQLQKISDRSAGQPRSDEL